MTALEERYRQARTAIRQVRIIHFRHDCKDCSCRLCWGVGGMCGGCRNPYPCPTVRALPDVENET